MTSSSKEGGLKAPTRHPLNWESPEFYDEQDLDRELHRVFDICHGCRRCFNLCDSFPRLFEAIDATPEETVEALPVDVFDTVNAACTLCDMCFMSKCPYVPPHEFNLDFPALMLRYRAVKRRPSQRERQRAKIDQSGTLAARPGVAAIANWATSLNNKVGRWCLEKTLHIDRRAALPPFESRTLMKQNFTPPINPEGPAWGKEVVLYATCLVNYNLCEIGQAAVAILAHHGIKVHTIYPQCCGMPQLELGDLATVAQKAQTLARALKPWVEGGYPIIPLMPSCALMFKTQWPLLLPRDENVQNLSQNTMDIMEFLLYLGEDNLLLMPKNKPQGPVALHIPCHTRAQNIGKCTQKLFKLFPDVDVHAIERCSGHGGTWGVCKENFSTALKIGRPVVRAALEKKPAYILSECPLACRHIQQGVEVMKKESPAPTFSHPLPLIAKLYDLL